MIFPELGQGEARGAADEDVGMVDAFFVLDAFRVCRCGRPRRQPVKIELACF